MGTRPAASSVAVLGSLALCAAAHPAAAAAEPTTVAGPEGILTLTTRTPTGQRGHWFVEFQEEIDQLPGSAGIASGSLRGAADVDCPAAQFKVAKFSLFAGPNLTGALLLDMGETTVWRSAKAGSTMDRVLAAACRKTKLEAKVQAGVQAEVQAVAARAAGAPLPARKPPAPPSATSHPPAAAKTVAQTGAQTGAKSVAPPPAAAAAGSAFYAQLAAVSSADAARQAWVRLQGAAPGVLDDRLRRLTAATVHGRRVYRVLAGGFATKAQAETVCKALARLSARCFVRPPDAAT